MEKQYYYTVKKDTNKIVAVSDKPTDQKYLKENNLKIIKHDYMVSPHLVEVKNSKIVFKQQENIQESKKDSEYKLIMREIFKIAIVSLNKGNSGIISDPYWLEYTK